MGDPALQRLRPLVGLWDTKATHPASPGLAVRGTAHFDWLEGERFLVLRARNDHPDFPDSIAIIGFTDHDRVDDVTTPAPASMTMHYFDSRGVFRVYEAGVDDQALRFHREAPGFSQRFTGTFADDGTTIAGQWEASEDGVHWEDDLRITYERRR